MHVDAAVPLVTARLHDMKLARLQTPVPQSIMVERTINSLLDEKKKQTYRNNNMKHSQKLYRKNNNIAQL